MTVSRYRVFVSLTSIMVAPRAVASCTDWRSLSTFCLLFSRKCNYLAALLSNYYASLSSITWSCIIFCTSGIWGCPAYEIFDEVMHYYVFRWLATQKLLKTKRFASLLFFLPSKRCTNCKLMHHTTWYFQVRWS